MNVLIVDDHPLIRKAIATAVTAENGQVLGETGSGTEAAELCIRLRPDIAVLDLQLIDLNGFDLAERILPLLPTLRILVISASINDHKLLRCEQLKLPGFIHKRYCETSTMRTALRELHAGRTFFCPHFHRFRDQSKGNSLAPVRLLTDAEIKVLSHIGQGLSNVEIAAALGTAVTTVLKHRSNLLHKLQLGGSPQLVHFAIEHGFADAGQ